MRSSREWFLLAGGASGFRAVSMKWFRSQRRGKTRVASLQIGGRKCQVWLVDLPNGRKWTFALGIRTSWHSPNYKGVIVKPVSGCSGNSEHDSQSPNTERSSQETGVGKRN